MRDRKFAVIEKIKSIVIVVLFALAILLLYFFLNNRNIYDVQNLISLPEINGGEEQIYQPELNALTLPSVITVNYGEARGNARNAVSPAMELPDEFDAGKGADEDPTVYEYIMKITDTVMRSDSAVETADPSSWGEIIDKSCLAVKYGCSIPFNQFMVNNDIKIPSEAKGISYLDEFCFLTGSRAGIYVNDSISGKLYKIVTDDLTDDFTPLLEYLYTTSETIGYNVPSAAPIAHHYYGRSVPCRYEFSLDSKEDILDIERQFFGTSMDFVRKITENKGTRLYIYGQSQKILFIKDDGIISYTEKLDADKYRENTFYDALGCADAFISSHGGWDDMLECGMVPYLSGATATGTADGKKGYIFEFGVIYKDMPVVNKNGNVVTVEVYGNQVTSYTRNAVTAVSQDGQAKPEVQSGITIRYSQGEKDQNSDNKPGISDIIDKNADMICTALNESIGSEYYSGGDAVKNVLVNIKNASVYMMRQDYGTADSTELIPVWNIKIENIVFLFNAQNGKLMEYSSNL